MWCVRSSRSFNQGVSLRQRAEPYAGRKNQSCKDSQAEGSAGTEAKLSLWKT